MHKENIPDNCVYGFTIYDKFITKSNKKYLLFRGIGVINDGKYERIPKYDYLTTKYGYKKLRNYYDMVSKFGNKPCIVFDLDNNVISDTIYNSQNEIADKYGIKISKLSNRAFTNKDIVEKTTRKGA